MKKSDKSLLIQIACVVILFFNLLRGIFEQRAEQFSSDLGVSLPILLSSVLGAVFWYLSEKWRKIYVYTTFSIIALGLVLMLLFSSRSEYEDASSSLLQGTHWVIPVGASDSLALSFIDNTKIELFSSGESRLLNYSVSGEAIQVTDDNGSLVLEWFFRLRDNRLQITDGNDTLELSRNY